MMLMIPQAASVLGCERLWLNISAMLTFLSFHAGSHVTIRVTSWTWITSAVALDLKRKLAQNLASPRFWIQIWIQKRGDTRFHRRSNSLRLPALPDPAARACRVRGGFSPPRAYTYYYYYYYDSSYYYYYYYCCCCYYYYYCYYYY